MAVNYGNAYLNSQLPRGVSRLQSQNQQTQFPVQWTILDTAGQQAFDFDVFMQQNVKTEVKITQMPVEGGSFVSYNMVQAPTEINCVLARQGRSDELNVYIDALFEMVNSTDLVSVVTPDREYRNMKLVSLSFDRTIDTGSDVIFAECSFQEVRQITSQYTNAKVASKISRGRQQGKTGSSKQRSLLTHVKK